MASFEGVEISPSDLVKCEAISGGWTGTEFVDKGDVFNLSGKFFQSGIPSWVKVLSVHETAVKLVEEVTLGTKKTARK